MSKAISYRRPPILDPEYYSDCCAVRTQQQELNRVEDIARRCEERARFMREYKGFAGAYYPVSLRALRPDGTLAMEFATDEDVTRAARKLREVAEQFRLKWGVDADRQVFPPAHIRRLQEPSTPRRIRYEVTL